MDGSVKIITNQYYALLELMHVLMWLELLRARSVNIQKFSLVHAVLAHIKSISAQSQNE